MRWLRDNALSICFGTLFLLALCGQAVAGYGTTLDERALHGQPPIGFWDFVFSSEFVVDVAENWQSEFLQFFVFILATIWLVQRGSPESKHPGDEGPKSDEDEKVGSHATADSPPSARAGGFRRFVFSNSLLLAMGTAFVLSWLAQSLAGTVVTNSQNAEHGRPPVTWPEYLVSADFWDRTLQNWQSEFLAVGTMVALSIFLRQRGSSEAKPVGAPHEQSAVESS